MQRKLDGMGKSAWMNNARALRASIRLQVVLLFMVSATFGQQCVGVANQFHGEYQNLKGFAYRVTLPLKLTGCADPSLPTSHSFSVDLSIKDGAFIWVDGSWNAALYPSPLFAAQEHLKGLKEEVRTIGAPSFRRSSLASLSAIRLRVEVENKEASEKRVQEEAVAIRNYSGDPVGVVYTVGLDTTTEPLSEDERVMGMVLASFRLDPQPNIGR
jgi:hypothetical protein